MLRGEVLARKIAVVTLRLRGAGQAEVDAEVILDTGFTEELALDAVIIGALGWPRRDTAQMILADGSLQSVSVYDGQVWWDGEWRSVLVQATTGMPLLGMSLLYGSLITLEAIDGGEVTIEPLE